MQKIVGEPTMGNHEKEIARLLPVDTVAELADYDDVLLVSRASLKCKC